MNLKMNGIRILEEESLNIYISSTFLHAKLSREEEKKQVFELLSSIFPGKKLQYTKSGKPYFENTQEDISISHSSGTTVVLSSKGFKAGIDIEIPRTTHKKVEHKYLQKEEIEKFGTSLENLCRLWCMKEAAFKTLDRKNVSFKTDLQVKSLNIYGEYSTGEVEYLPEALTICLKMLSISPFIIAYTVPPIK